MKSLQLSTLLIILSAILLITSCEITRTVKKGPSSKAFKNFNPDHIQTNESINKTNFTPPALNENIFFNPQLPQVNTPYNTITDDSLINKNDSLINEIPPLGTENEAKIEHIVRKNESFWSIAKRYKIKYKDLMATNDATANTILQPGMKILLPANLSSRSLKYNTKNSSNIIYKKIPSNNKYIVKKNDNLWVIARIFGLSVNDIKRLNHLSTNTIYPGKTLILRQTTKTKKRTITKRKTKSIPKKLVKKTVKSNLEIFEHPIAPGDTIKSIARLYGSNSTLIKKHNNINTDAQLQKKSIIKVPIPR